MRLPDGYSVRIAWGSTETTAIGKTHPTLSTCSRKFIILKNEFQLPVRKPLIEKNKQGPKKETEKRKTDIPKEFIKKIKNLGLKVEDAEILYKSKIDWTAIYSENKIYCVEPRCDYFTKIDGEELTNHMINVHKYGDFQCNYDHCDYVATSKVKILPYYCLCDLHTEK